MVALGGLLEPRNDVAVQGPGGGGTCWLWAGVAAVQRGFVTSWSPTGLCQPLCALSVLCWWVGGSSVVCVILPLFTWRCSCLIFVLNTVRSV